MCDHTKKGGKVPFGEGSRVQSLIFEKRYYDAAHAKKKAKEMGFKADKVDVKVNTVRIRQESPGQYKAFRTIDLNKSGTIKAAIGIKHPRPDKQTGGASKSAKEKPKTSAKTPAKASAKPRNAKK